MTVKEISKLSGVSVRTLHHYDNIGLLRPSRSPSGYRQYTQKDLERLQLILFFRELQFPLKDIPIIIDAPDFDRTRALEQQVELLTLQKKAPGKSHHAGPIRRLHRSEAYYHEQS